MIELRHIKKAFHAGSQAQNILCGADLKVDPGEYVAIMGKSGSGKSTLLK